MALTLGGGTAAKPPTSGGGGGVSGTGCVGDLPFFGSSGERAMHMDGLSPVDPVEALEAASLPTTLSAGGGGGLRLTMRMLFDGPA